jgi:hypothetical protein
MRIKIEFSDICNTYFFPTAEPASPKPVCFRKRFRALSQRAEPAEAIGKTGSQLPEKQNNSAESRNKPAMVKFPAETCNCRPALIGRRGVPEICGACLSLGGASLNIRDASSNV